MVIGEAFLIMKIWILLGWMMLSQLSLAADVPGSSDLVELKDPPDLRSFDTLKESSRLFVSR